MAETGGTKKEFDFSTGKGILEASQEVASASFNQSIPLQNIVGVNRAVSAALRLAELQLRYEMFRAKVTGAKEIKEIKTLQLEAS